MFQVAASIALALTASAPAWTLATPAPEGVDEVGPEVMADGGALVRVTLTYAASVDAAQLATRWIAAFEAAGWRVVDRADEGFDVAATLDKDDLRASFAVGRAYGGSAHGYGWLTLGKARASAFQAPGPCLPIPRRGWGWYVHSSGVDQRGELNQRSVAHSASSYPAVDLDGDLVLDWLVPVVVERAADGGSKKPGATPTACPEDVTWEVWLARPTAPGAGPDARCGHPVGVIGPGTLDGAAWQAPFEHGLRTLVVTREKSALSDVIEGGGPIPALTRETRTARFDGARYRQAAPQSMTGRCYHCATWHCSGPEPLPAPPAAPRGAPR